MNKDELQEFYELYDIEKVEYEVPGRDLDDEGNVASWYVEEEYPYLTNFVFLQLFAFGMNYHDETGIENAEQLKKEIIDQLVEIAKNEKDTEKFKQLKEKVQQTIREENDEDLED